MSDFNGVGYRGKTGRLKPTLDFPGKHTLLAQKYQP